MGTLRLHSYCRQLLITTALIALPALCAEDEPAAVLVDMRAPTVADDAAIAIADDPAILQEYQGLIAQIEAEQGAYAAALPEQLLGYGTTLQQFERHAEAVEVLRRAAHLARINGGLYSSEQIALLKAEIRSHLALGDYSAVDDRQRYLYRVERRALDNPEASAIALLAQADWQQQAYRLGVGDEDTLSGRLMLMWDLYRMALTGYLKAYGDTAVELRAPLMGMLRSQYLIAGFRGYDQNNAQTTAEARLIALNSEAYKRGKSVIEALVEIDVANKLPFEQQLVDTVALGDWALWFGKSDEATSRYTQAINLLSSSDTDTDTDTDTEANDRLLAMLFGDPTPLPAIPGLAPFPTPEHGDSGELVLTFDVTETGRVTNFERTRQPDVKEGGRELMRLIRAVRDARFRPRFEQGLPVATEGIVWSWNADAWSVDTTLPTSDY